MDTEKFEIFEKYLTGQMSAEEQQAFESDISTDKELAENFYLYRYIETDRKGSVGSLEREMRLRQSLKEVSVEFISEKPSNRGKRQVLMYFLRGAAAMLLLGAAWFFLLRSGSTDIREEVSTYYAENFDLLGQTMGVENEQQLAIEAYNSKDYEQAVGLFESILKANPENNEVLKNLGLSYLAMSDYDSALSVFDKLTNVRGLYVNEGKFLYAMTLLLRGGESDREEAEKLLENIVEEGKPGSLQAELWLESMRR